VAAIVAIRDGIRNGTEGKKGDKERIVKVHRVR
jgi:hypothetical protein